MHHINITRAKPKFKKATSAQKCATSAQKCATIGFYKLDNKLHIPKI